jgi:type II secretory pathway pseudopilin PulG
MKHLGVVILILVAALFSSVAIPNFLIALNRSRQKRTMATLRDWGQAFESASHRHPPDVDGWDHPLRITRGAKGGYTIRSAGRDGKFDAVIHPGATSSFDADLVYANGSFIVWPEGV